MHEPFMEKVRNFPSADYASRLKEIVSLATALDSRSKDLCAAAALDAGFPVKVTATEIRLAVEFLRTMEEEVTLMENGLPYGTIAAILPYDAPTIMLARLAGTALLTGNRLRFSFSSKIPRTAVLIAEICAGFDALEPIVGEDNRRFGRRCIEDETVRVLFISGALELGEMYRCHRKAFDKLFFAGPGGMPAAVVFKDADIEAASRFIARRAFINGGQYCTALKKVLIHRDVYQAVRDFVLKSVTRLKIGNPLDPDTDVGPILAEKTRLSLQKARQECSGARLLFGSIKDETVSPLIFEMDNGQVPDLEIFGPFLLLKPFHDVEMMIRDLTRSRYGLFLAMFGAPPKQVKETCLAHFGMVRMNPDFHSYFHFTPLLRLPFGGKKASGWILERQEGGWAERDGAFLYTKELVRRPIRSCARALAVNF